jgi:hypothetical protein
VIVVKISGLARSITSIGVHPAVGAPFVIQTC